MGRNLSVVIMKDNGEYLVEPARLVVRYSDTVCFVSLIDTDALVEIREPQIFQNREMTIKAMADSGELPIQEVPKGVYHYGIFCKLGGNTNGVFARGNSDPVIVVEGRG